MVMIAGMKRDGHEKQFVGKIDMTVFTSLLCSKLSMTYFLQNKVLTPYHDI